MCHDWEFEMVRKAYFEQVARRKREQEKAEKKPAPPAAQPAPPKPAEAPRVTDKEPVPA